MKTLRLAVKREFFEAIKSGVKTEEFRRVIPHFDKLLAPEKGYTHLVITLGYPKRGCAERELHFPYRGWRKRIITHSFFGLDPVEVYAIKLEA